MVDCKAMPDRFELRELYIQGWCELDANKLIQAVTDDFLFDDPAEPAPIGKADLGDYMRRWDVRTRRLGADNLWILADEVRQDRDGILTDWEWWELPGSPLKGMALVKTSDQGVLLERITYFDRGPEKRQTE